MRFGAKSPFCYEIACEAKGKGHFNFHNVSISDLKMTPLDNIYLR